MNEDDRAPVVVPITRAALSPIILFAAAVHILWAVLLCFGKDAGRTPPLSELVETTTRYPAAGMMVGAALLSLYGLTRHDGQGGKHRASWWPFVPQQALLVIASLSVLHSAVNQTTFFGPRPWESIVAASAAALLLAVFHTLAVSVLVAEDALDVQLLREDKVAEVYERMQEVEDENASLHAELEHRLTLSGGSRPDSEEVLSRWPHPERN